MAAPRRDSTPHGLLNALGSPAAARDFLRQLATAVCEDARSHESSRKAADAAAATLLADLVDLVVPALPYCATKVAIAGTQVLRGDDGASADELRTFLRRDETDVRALHVAGDAGPVKLAQPGASTGSFSGTGLWLADTGDFVELRFSGQWSTSPTTRDWHSTARFLTAAEAAAAWKPEEIVENLGVQLHRQQRGTPIAHVTRRTAILQAVHTLLAAH
ncbi:hypothetical protein QEG98_42120 (plasmid) [Myxococcus sp. MxC21-1]|uniref:hypothetical protein n=1 Tax=Myxococcus sp. MxC21-1 TaxID=3041439 RepID=UPI00292CB64C|nr:hypothetical protein [Myxococcus sp. MxC21-1]WNZ66218.1 hypothetical protein QEG98_42120 [Myxococcus sp. MxC21-1]